MNITIRPACSKDIPHLCDLLSDLFVQETDFEPDQGRQSRGLNLLVHDQSGRSLVLVAASRDEIVGMCTVQTLISTAEGGPVGLVSKMSSCARIAVDRASERNCWTRPSPGARQRTCAGFNSWRTGRTVPRSHFTPPAAGARPASYASESISDERREIHSGRIVLKCLNIAQHLFPSWTPTS